MNLITGATGLVGSHLALHLVEKNMSVRAMYRSLSAIEKTKSVFDLYRKEFLFEKIEWIRADITDVPSLEKAFIGVDDVYHCAAFLSFDPAGEVLLRKTNIEGTANIVNCCLSYHVKKLCFVSSIAALGDLKAHETILTEETEWNPEQFHSDYAISKHGAEMEVWRGFQEGLPTIIVSPGVVLGPLFWNSGSGEIFTRVANGLRFYTKGATGFVAVPDVVKIMFELMKSDVSGERFIVVAENRTFKNILAKVADALLVDRPVLEGKYWMTELSWRLDWILSVSFNRRRKLSKAMARALHQSHFISNEKLKDALPFQFEPIDDTIVSIARSLKH